MYIITYDGKIRFLEKNVYEEVYYIERFKKEFDVFNPYVVCKDRSFYLYKKNMLLKSNEKKDT